jgi:pimeloyl-ACP methyl ester carboxylesterase
MTDSVMSIWSAVNNELDILLVDQRGTGRSNPLSCRPPAEPISKPAEMRAFVRSCLGAAPGDMRFYGTRAAMDDLEAVRVALGYRQLNVYGTSYGATAAQVYLKRHPASVRSVVLDGGTAIDVPFYGRFALNAERALAQVAKRCAAGRACRRAYPNWRGQLSTLIRRWDAHPVRNRKGETINGAGLAGVIQGMLMDAGDAAEIPYLVNRAAAGDYRRLNERISDDGPILQLMYWSIWCNEPWVGMGARGPWGTDFDSYARSSIASHRQSCSYLPKRAEPASAWASPRSRVPLLALAGGADPQDPISNLPRLKQLWPNGRAIVVPHLGHAIGQEGCLGELVAHFVARGSAAGLDSRCVRKITPAMFELP